MFDRISKLLNFGYSPDLILDIGAFVGNWSNDMWLLYPEKNYMLFEPIDYPELHKLKDPHVFVHNIVLNDECKEVDWYQQKNTGDSMFREKTHYFENCEVLKKQSITLDHFFETHEAERKVLEQSKNIFVKIDCQGAEIPILKGAAKSILHKTDFIILEIPFFGQYNKGVASFLEHIKFMDEIGFVPFDLLERHYCNEIAIQVDIMFIRKTHELYANVDKIIY